MVAAPAPAGHRVNANPISGIERLRRHAWVVDARHGNAPGDTPGIALALSDAGVDALCRLGREQLIHILHREAGYTGTPVSWRLCETWPLHTSDEQIDAWLQAPLPRDALLLDEREQDGTWTLALRVPLDLGYFPGHFPQAPVLPGVVQVDWALRLAAPRLGTPGRCQVMEALKFQQLLRPGDRADLSLHYDAVRHKLHFAYRYGDKAYSSGRLAWSAA
jgi:3-hydroxymyristoyl/3-hydroxydecanoyl-(acyl carrier protein) dehydratase